ncbi:unnamed protein product [Rodentolepis nana]|uniref:D-aminoacyl-tRNA deacylase n=1 Tax=Rodentolepis nana TaxID=102285 RepID=A0A3P7S0K7_RODNA|nr:unnamed protein product [Rodentolepis nana]
MKGNKLDFHLAMAPPSSQSVYESFLAKVRAEFKDPNRVKGDQYGAFGKMMDVSLVNEGPVTITLDSRTRGSPPSDPLSTSTSSGDNRKAGNDDDDDDYDENGTK